MTTHARDQRTVRLQKAEAWQQLLGYTYAKHYDRTHTALQAITVCEREPLRPVEAVTADCHDAARVCGRITQMREMGKLAFLRLQDASGSLQICLNGEVLGDTMPQMLRLLDMGDFCGFGGEFFITRKGEPTLMARTITPLSKALLPLPEKFHGLTDTEASYRQRYLDLLSNEDTYARFQLRSKVIRTIRRFLDERDFTEIETRTLGLQTGGALARVFETHHNALDTPMVLRIALEIDHKLAMTGRFERVYEIGKCFRNEGTDPSHLQEFTMLEWYAAYKDMHWSMQEMQRLFHTLLDECLGTRQFTVLDKQGQPVLIDASAAFPQVNFAELLLVHAGLDIFSASDETVRTMAVEQYHLPANEAEKTSRANLLDYIYKKSARPHLVQPTYVMHYPTELKPLARPNGDGTSECYQLVLAGWEIMNAYGELIDPRTQRQLLEEQAAAKDAGDEEAMEVNEEFLTAMEHGMPPMTGFGMGIDRLVALLTTQPNLRDVVLFPMMKEDKPPLSHREAEEAYRRKKVVVIADPSKPLGSMANALAQLGISIGGHSHQPLFHANTLEDADGQVHYTDCFYGMVNLAGTQEDMHHFLDACYRANIQVFDFSQIMRQAHTDRQMREGYHAQKTHEIDYYAVGALVPADFEREFLSTLSLYGAA
ncbi:lysine--tRNA ligase [Candidatus Peribacteria bacterium]|nr:lysine--tRNA ligase [Candidatus Peribacteria bacterium]